MTKPVVGTAVQLLAAEGKLSLDDSVSQYIKTFQNERSRTITIRQLLTHTGGFTQPGFPRGSIYQYTSLSDAVAHLGEIGPDVPPGSEFIYSDAGTSTLTEIVSRVSGMSADQYIHSRIFNPLGMHNSFCFVPDQRRVRKHTNSTFEWKDSCFVEYWDRFDEPEIPFFRGSGGIYCTAKDYARFLHEWARPGNSFLSAEVKEVALKPGELSQSYGMQWEIIHSENGKMEVFGHGGSDGTLGMAIPGKKLLICYFTQSRSSLTVGRFKRYILDALNIRKIDPVKAIKIPEEKLEIFCGRFENEHYFIRTEFMVKNHKFYYTVNGSPRIHLIPVSKNSFEMEDMDYKIDFIQKNGRCNALKIYNNEKSYDLQRID